jgi:NADH dehydrogenase [ubiquinone] 1 alpha subcomplex assembly factor 7
MTRDPLGAAGDFTTAPEISQMFGELIGLWAARSLVADGAPAAGAPGRARAGARHADGRRAARGARRCRLSAPRLSVHLVEMSPLLSAAPARRWPTAASRHLAHASADVPPGPAIFIANEFFDALPVRQFVRTRRLARADGRPRSGGSASCSGLSSEPEPYLSAEAPVGALLEVGAEGQRTMTALVRAPHGAGRRAARHRLWPYATDLGETLQAVRDHRYADPLDNPGEADLTTHVDFAALGRAAKSTGAPCMAR